MERPPAPPGIDLTEDRRPAIIAASFVTWILALISIGMRIACRRMKGVALGLDDWLILASVIPSGAHVFGMAGYSVSRGLGQHIWATPPDSIKAWAIGLFIAELGYFFTLLCVKWSILAFYWRSFHIRKSIRAPIWILAIIILLWGIAVILITLLQCLPTHAFWSRFDPINPLPPSDYHCGINDMMFFYANAIPTIITDVLMLILPIPYIYTLKLAKGQKVALGGVFLVGTFVTMVSIIRLHYLLHGDLKDPDLTWNFVDMGLWSVLESNVAMLCACLPFLRPFMSKLTFGIFNLSSPGPGSQRSLTLGKATFNKSTNSSNWNETGYHGTTTTVKAKSDGDGNGDSDSDRNLFGIDAIQFRTITPTRRDEEASVNSIHGAVRIDSSEEGIMVTREFVMERDSYKPKPGIC